MRVRLLQRAAWQVATLGTGWAWTAASQMYAHPKPGLRMQLPLQRPGLTAMRMQGQKGGAATAAPSEAQVLPVFCSSCNKRPFAGWPTSATDTDTGAAETGSCACRCLPAGPRRRLGRKRPRFLCGTRQGQGVKGLLAAQGHLCTCALPASTHCWSICMLGVLSSSEHSSPQSAAWSG